MNTKILPYFRSQFRRLFVILFTAPSFSVRKFVLLCSHHLTIFFLFSIQLLRQHKEVQCLHHALCSARLASGLYTSYNEHFQSNLSKSIIQSASYHAFFKTHFSFILSYFIHIHISIRIILSKHPYSHFYLLIYSYLSPT